MVLCSISLHPIVPPSLVVPAPIFGVLHEPSVPPRHSSCCSEAEHPQQQEAGAEAGLSYFCPAQARGFPETSVGAKLRQGEGQSCPRTLGRGQMAPRGQLGLEMKEKQEEEERDTRAGCSLTSS